MRSAEELTYKDAEQIGKRVKIFYNMIGHLGDPHIGTARATWKSKYNGTSDEFDVIRAISKALGLTKRIGEGEGNCRLVQDKIDLYAKN